MPNNYVLLEKITVGAAGAASVTFANIPQTGYTDLVIKGSARSLRASDEDGMAFGINGNGATNWQLLSGNGSSASTGTLSSLGFGAAFIGRIPAANVTANTFGNFELYLPNYTSSIAKSYSTDAVTETNGATAYSSLLAAYQSNTAAVSSVILLASNANLAANSTFYLYGVAKLNTTPAIAPKATGGDIVMTDGTYWYHAFRSSGTFTPAANLSCDVLQVAGGGGGGSRSGGGGGAGGISYLASQSLTITNYTVTVGAGGTPGSRSVNGTNGSNSQFGSLTLASGGGVGASAVGNLYGTNGNSGGSGGGGANNGSGGAGTSGQGFAGGNSNGTSFDAAGGGGAGAVGANASSVSLGSGAGAGGAGVNTYSTWLNTTGTGVSGFIAGGGGGGSFGSSNHGAGGSGGGGTGADSAPTAGTANTGGGGGGAGNSANTNTTPTGAAGGSGLVIVRYLVA
jgi:hypothetical protein